MTALLTTVVLLSCDGADPVCGNGIVESPEECDDGRNGGEMDGCTDDCMFSCHVPTAAADCREAWDDCTEQRCVPGGLGQVCETVNATGQCRYPGCRDDAMDLGSCVDGVCVCWPGCGNGFVEPPEECDDGWSGEPMDGCTDDCEFSCHAATEAVDCGDEPDDCIDVVCVIRSGSAPGQVCAPENHVGDCAYPGCTSEPLAPDRGVCADGACACPGGDAGVGPDGDADAPD